MADTKDMSAVGNAATAKKSPSGALKLKSFSVDFSDNGGATVREIRERKVPEGRRAGSGFPMGSDVKENTFEDMGRARAYITTLMSPAAPANPTPPRPATPPTPPMRPPVAAAAVRVPPAAPPAPRPMPPMGPPMGGGPGL